MTPTTSRKKCLSLVFVCLLCLRHYSLRTVHLVFICTPYREHVWSSEVVVAAWARHEFDTPASISERRLNHQLYQRFRICGVDTRAQTIEVYFLDQFPDRLSALRHVQIQGTHERMGRNLAVQTKTFADVLEDATFLTHDDVLNNVGFKMPGMTLRKAIACSSVCVIAGSYTESSDETTAMDSASSCGSFDSVVRYVSSPDWLYDRDDSHAFT